MTSDERYMLWYKAEIEGFAPLSPDEERTCIEHIRARDEFAMSPRERLVEAYSSLVVAIAETYGDRVVHVPDLFVDGNTENNRRAKFYRLTAKGRRQLHVETTRWEKLARAIANILKPASEESV
jgi:DNA-directed RNA polymerase sigma subunit (sigma70/sigma32)